MTFEEVMKKLKSLSNPDAVAGMAHFGIYEEKAYGVSIPTLRKMARQIGRDHALAQQLWSTRILEARGIASMIDDPALVTEAQMERWSRDFSSWAVCDGCCSNLFDKTRFAYQKALEWSSREKEYVKRGGFVLIAALAVHDKKADDSRFRQFFPIIVREATDERNFVKKAVNWALRQIGKRNPLLNQMAIHVARDIQRIDSKAARWIAADALRELTSTKVKNRLRARSRRIPAASRGPKH